MATRSKKNPLEWPAMQAERCVVVIAERVSLEGSEASWTAAGIGNFPVPFRNNPTQ